MSPLARLRQVATCSVIAYFAGVGLFGVALAADPPSQLPRPATTATTATSHPAPTSAPAASSTSSAPAATAASSVAAATPASSAPAATSSVAAAAAAPESAEHPALSPQTVQLVPDVAAQIAHSALLTVEGTVTADALQLRIRRVSDKSLVGGDDVTVAIDGRNQSVTHEKGSFYEVPINDMRGDGARDVDVTVAHDGIREIVSGKVSMVEASSAGSLLRDHKQVAWWILNIVIVLVAVMAFSRRKG